LDQEIDHVTPSLRRGSRWLAGWAAVLLPLAAPAAPDILKPDQAFRYKVTSVGDEIIVSWTIEPGHYLYKERMGYSSATDGLELGAAILPAGKPYEDEFFGRMEIYRGNAVVRIPVSARPSGARTAVLEVRSQGCADIGLCYPPQTWMAEISFDESQSAGRLAQLLGQRGPAVGAGEPLPAGLAFRPDVEVIDPFTLRISWAIEDGYYLYRDSLQVNTESATAQLGPVLFPQGTPKWDEHFGDTWVFYQTTAADIAVSRSTSAEVVLPLRLDYQGCKEDSICYPPDSVLLDVVLPAASAADAPRAPPGGSGEVVSEQGRLSRMILEGNLLLVISTFVGLGLLLAFTPCVLPMVPILSGIIAGQGKDVTTGRAFTLSLVYVLGMAFTYTLAGAAFAAAGGQIQAALQKPWILISVAAVFVVLAMSMFGLFELQVPAAIQTRLAQASGRQRTGTFIGTAVMGALSALIVTTCVAPPLVASLTVIAQAGDVARGALSLFALSIGMGIPLLVVGTSAGRLLPKAGAWMNAVKGAFGFAMLGLAVWMLERILPGAITLALWAVLVFMAGVFLGAFQTLDSAATATSKLGKGLGLLASLYGAALLLGALSGADDPFRPLRFSAVSDAEHELSFKPVKTIQDLNREVAQAAAAGRPVMLDFYADWCVSCKEMERYTFSDPQVQSVLADAVLLQADVTANDAADQALLNHFGIFGPPTIVFFRGDGEETPGYRVVGFMPADQFANHVQRALTPDGAA
jgi:thiol:disulfide interchange protein DsbD